jgi:cytidylate kinase
LRPSANDWQAYQNQVERIIRELSDAGEVVIVGRGGQVVLRGRPDVWHVRVIAPPEARVARLQEERKVSAESARACLEASDRARARFLRRSHGVNVADPALYHLTINTGLLDLPQAVDLIVRAVQARADAWSA